jgi:hypothetical protein
MLFFQIRRNVILELLPANIRDYRRLIDGSVEFQPDIRPRMFAQRQRGFGRAFLCEQKADHGVLWGRVSVFSLL